MSFDGSRIKHHPDKKSLADVKRYFKAFVTHDADALKAMQTTDYTMTDIRKPAQHSFPSLLPPPPPSSSPPLLTLLSLLFSSLLFSSLRCQSQPQCLVLSQQKLLARGLRHGNHRPISRREFRPGSITVMEFINCFEMVNEARPGSEDKLLPGAKAGDTVTMVVQSMIWWTESGKIKREQEYRRLAWKGFGIEERDRTMDREREKEKRERR